MRGQDIKKKMRKFTAPLAERNILQVNQNLPLPDAISNFGGYGVWVGCASSRSETDNAVSSFGDRSHLSVVDHVPSVWGKRAFKILINMR